MSQLRNLCIYHNSCSIRIAAVPHFPGLRRFPQGRGFKQWTGDDSKALMKVSYTMRYRYLSHLSVKQVWLPAISGYLPPRMVQTFSAFLEFCYLVRRDVIDEDVISGVDVALARFHQARTIFEEVGVRPNGFSLPRQHALAHYVEVIQAFGAPNGLCSSITESKHIKAVKQPWRRSNRYKALGQMLVTNSRIDKLAALRVHLDTHNMLDVPVVPGPSAVAAGSGAGHADSIGTDRSQSREDASHIEEDNDGEAVEGDIEAEVVLSKTPGADVVFSFLITLYLQWNE